MKFNKKGAMPAGIKTLLGFAVLIAVIIGGVLLVDFLKGSNNPLNGNFDLDNYLASSQKVGDAIGKPSFNFLSYIIGEIPQPIIDATSPVGSLIVIVSVFVILLLMFGDIMTLFGSFSSEAISWTIGAALTIIAANMKVVMMFAAMGFMLVSGIGVFAAFLGVLVPFIVYIVIHILFLGNLKVWAQGTKDAAAFNAGVTDIEQGIKGAKSFAKAVRT